jgi:hypothetical protein
LQVVEVFHGVFSKADRLPRCRARFTCEGQSGRSRQRPRSDEAGVAVGGRDLCAACAARGRRARGAQSERESAQT